MWRVTWLKQIDHLCNKCIEFPYHWEKDIPAVTQNLNIYVLIINKILWGIFPFLP